LEVITIVGRFFVTVRIVAAALAITFVVVQQTEGAQVGIPSVGQCNTVPVDLLLIVSFTASSAETLTEAVVAVIEVSAW